MIGYLYGQYKKLRNEWVGILTGKPAGFGGSNIRPEATGYGLVYFTQHLMVRCIIETLRVTRLRVACNVCAWCGSTCLSCLFDV